MWRIILLALALAGCSGGSPSQPPNADNGWTNFGKGGVHSPLSNTFVFPSQSSNQVIGYVYTAPPSGNIMGKTMTLDYTVTLDGALGVADPTDVPPASITLFLWEKGDNLSGTNGYQYYRWWCPTRGGLTNGAHILSCVVGSQWTDTVGKPVVGAGDPNSVAGFDKALANLFAVGFTCGGANFYGHGCWSTAGTVTFKINSWSVQ